MESLGMIELNSIARGIEAGDAIVKTAHVKLIGAYASCPGKYVVMIRGSVSAVKSAIEVGAKVAGKSLVKDIIIASIHEQVFTALSCTTEIVPKGAVGIIETYSLATAVLVSDAAVKAANVVLLEIRLGRGLGGKAFTILTGDVSDVKAAVEAAIDANKDDGLLAHTAVIPKISKEMLQTLL
ncbi:MAG: BMC domain-containing protein [Tenericutes bacterium]|nr:BMC domain-containing protein [Mycoplasmatota bacterium]